MKKLLVATLIANLILQASFISRLTAAEKLDIAFDEANLIKIIVEEGSSKLLVASEKSIYESDDKREHWSKIFTVIGQNESVVDTLFIEEDIFIASNEAVYLFNRGNSETKRCFNAKSSREECVNSIFKLSTDKSIIIYICTTKGLYISDSQRQKFKEIKLFRNKNLFEMTYLDGYLYLLAEDGLYKSMYADFKNPKKIMYIAQRNLEDIENEESLKGFALTKTGNRIIPSKDGEIFISNEIVTKFNRLTINGLSSKDINDLYFYDNQLYISTDDGLYSSGITKAHKAKRVLTIKTNSLIADKDMLLAATTDGLYSISLKSEAKEGLADPSNDLKRFIKNQIETEPSIIDIQDAAIEYSEVNPDKIKDMRRSARNSAWLPTLSVGADYDEDSNINIDRGGTNDPDVFIYGPEEKGWGWDLSLSWDLGKLVWNDDQTSIDTRSKLMVQLRDDILSDVTSLYYERKRAQLDILKRDYKEDILMNKVLRLDELTARINGLTGLKLGESFSSACIGEVYASKEEE